MTIQVLSTREKRNFSILDNLNVSVEITDNPYGIPLDSVFGMAARNNPKRSYLFVSKLIGKHIPVKPETPQLTGFLLASRLAGYLGLGVDSNLINNMVDLLPMGVNHKVYGLYNLPGKAVFIGFAETATGLGHAVFDSFTGNINYLHSTREPLAGSFDTIYFTEAHCHAPEQKLLINCPQVLKNADYVVLIDDEITSGNLCLNMIRSIQKKYPQKHYIILSILDWRTKPAKQKYKEMAASWGVEISVISLISGVFTAVGDSPVITASPVLTQGDMPPVEMYPGLFIESSVETSSARYLKYTGRFGLDEKNHRLLKSMAGELGNRLSKLRQGEKTLLLGTGEFMYIPFLIAAGMGKGVYVQSTTRSPVHPLAKENYAVKHAITFKEPYSENIINFVYNIPKNFYDEVFVFWEREVLPRQVKPLLIAFKDLGIKHIILVSAV